MTSKVIRSVNDKAQHSRSVSEVAATFSGTYHACNRGETTWFGFASEAIRQLHALRPELKLASLLPITTAEYPTPAARPANSRLDCSKLANQLQITLPEWQESLQKVLLSKPV